MPKVATDDSGVVGAMQCADAIRCGDAMPLPGVAIIHER